jgi:NAD+-dependent secondary alcohol dehydrogenase Adh1
LTAYHAIKKAVPILYPGTRAVLIGAGGLGHIGVQSLKALTAATVIVVDRSEAALQLVRDCEADHVVVADGSQVARVRDLTESAGCEAVIDFIGEGGALEDGIAMPRRAGTYYVIGYGGVLQVPAIDIISTEINFRRQPGWHLRRSGRAHDARRARSGDASHPDLPARRRQRRHV